MPAPSTPGGILAQVVLKSDTGFPRDSIVNTFHFKIADPTAAIPDVEADIATALASFYNDQHHTGINQIRWYLSSTLDNGTVQAQVKLYHMTDAHPRVPVIWPWTLGASAGSDGGLPSECAVCISYKGTAPNPRRGYGRVFIGPLHSNAVLIEPPNIHMNTGMVSALQWGARYLIDDGASSRATRGIWSVYSAADNALYPVTSAWIDNEFDTQRRRGHRATARTFA
jgi:hypothetical protein